MPIITSSALPTSLLSRDSVSLSSTSSSAEASASASTGASSFQTLCSSLCGVLTSQSLASWLDPGKTDKVIDIENEDQCGIGFLSAHAVSVSVKGPCYEHEGNNDMTVALDTPQRVGHRANVVDLDYESDASGPSEPAGLTDSSSEDDTVAPGGRVRRIVKGIEKFRWVRRVRQRRPFAPIAQVSEDEPPGLNPSSEEECPDSHD